MRDFVVPPGIGAGPRDGTAPVAVRPLRDAATVMLVRDSPSAGVDVFVFRRVRGMAFAAGMLVFPGGAVDPADDDPRLVWPNGGPGQVEPRIAAAAVRETFEECGVLLGRGELGLDTVALEALRTDLLAARTTLPDVLAAAGLALDDALLHPWAHWVTPDFEPRRYDTRFFVARVPEGQEPRDLGGEGEQARWINARQALRQVAGGELAVLPPTMVCLEDLASADGVDALFATPRRLRPVSPWLVEEPGDDGEPVTLLRVHLDGVGGGDPRGTA